MSELAMAAAMTPRGLGSSRLRGEQEPGEERRAGAGAAALLLFLHRGREAAMQRAGGGEKRRANLKQEEALAPFSGHVHPPGYLVTVTHSEHHNNPLTFLSSEWTDSSEEGKAKNPDP